MQNNTKRIIKIVGLSVFFTFIVIYSLWRSSELLFGIKIKNVNIVDGSTYTEETVQVSGKAKNAIKLTLNGREISIDRSGNFEETVALFSGYNIITLEAKDKFGSMDKKVFKVLGKFNEETN
jgi:hypothetical protein